MAQSTLENCFAGLIRSARLKGRLADAVDDAATGGLTDFILTEATPEEALELLTGFRGIKNAAVRRNLVILTSFLGEQT